MTPHARSAPSTSCRPRSFRMTRFPRLALAISLGACIYACSHSESSPSGTTKNSAVGRWQAGIASPNGQLQQCLMDISENGRIAYSDSCPMPLTGQQATITTSPDGTFAPNAFVAGKDSGTFMIMGGSIGGMVGAFRVEGGKHMTT